MIDIHVSVRRLRGRMQSARRDDDRARADDTLPEREGRPSLSKTLIGTVRGEMARRVRALRSATAFHARCVA